MERHYGLVPKKTGVDWIQLAQESVHRRDLVNIYYKMIVLTFNIANSLLTKSILTYYQAFISSGFIGHSWSSSGVT
jgi:hypothetical protein